MIHSIHVYTKAENTKSKYILKSCSAEYEPLNQKARTSDEIPLYVCSLPPAVKAIDERKPNLCLVNARRNYLSGLFFPHAENPFLGYGDIGNDGILVSMRETGFLEVIVFPESKHLCMALYTLFADHDRDLLDEIQAHRKAMQETKGQG